LVSSGNILFFGEGKGFIHAVNAETGEKLWQYECDGGANGGFSAYKIDNK
jgi:alcohol dehydrogenase (cytochrome c)